jgi:hypothetical protein
VEDITKIKLKEIKWEGMDWIHLAKDRNEWWALATKVMNLRIS